ncbi:hypothetical protein [Chitinolyticbacter meiyuanensis]|uniref:hypothetical protein n=1 Tax=Chitinolyticbacter meiyuanensis TaxID=682798 RepID=UPI0011E60457|nr:hypothetical protein [Chitinolyticbacter meiyuanensis]
MKLLPTLSLLLTTLPVLATEPMPILFNQRPPLYYIEADASGQPVYAGHVYEKVRDALLRAGLQAQFREMPGARVVSQVKGNAEPLCAMGWFKTRERATFAQFSVPLHRDRAWVIVTRPEHEAEIRKLGSLKAVLAKRTLSATLIGGISFGDTIDSQLKRYPVERVSAGPTTVLKMIEAGHGEYTIVPIDSLEDHLTRVDPQSPLRAVTPSDVEGELVYLMCNKRVPPSWLGQFNAAWQAGR